jgi:hypothetical protein
VNTVMIEIEEEKTFRVQVEKSGGNEDCQGSHMEEVKKEDPTSGRNENPKDNC